MKIERDKSRINIVYDMTRRCLWNCAICCMGGRPGEDALEGELPLERKLALMDELAEINETRDVHIDFSGGEPLMDLSNLQVIERAADILGRERVGLSSSGFGIDDAIARRLSKCISDCEMTLDTVPGTPYPLRPFGYALAAAQAVPHLRRYGIEVGIQTVLTRANSGEYILRALYDWLCKNQADVWSLLPFYPSGRGAAYPEQRLDKAAERRAVRFIQELNLRNPAANKPRLDFHYTMDGHEKSSNVCRCVRRSIGVLPDGKVTACFWAVDSDTDVIDPKYLLGSLKTQTLREILNGERAAYWTSCPHSCELEIA